MEKVTKEYEIFKFEELSDKAKEKALQWFSEDSDLWQWHSEDLIEILKSEAPKYFKVEDVHYSGFWSQGDGASWVGEIDLKAYAEEKKDSKLLAAIEIGAIEDKPIVYQEGRHSHEMTMHVKVSSCDYLDEEQEKELGITNFQIGEMIVTLRDTLLEEARDYAREIYSALMCEYDHIYSEENLQDMAEANEWRFLANGSFFVR